MSFLPPRPSTRDVGLRVGAPLAFFVVFVAIWHIAAKNEWTSSFILPAPGDVARSFYELVFEVGIWEDIWATTQVTILGFLLGSALGIVLAIATGLSRVLNATLYPFIVALQVTPRVAIAPLLIAWLGFGTSPKVAFVVLVVFFPVFVNTLTGIQSVDAEAREMFRSLGANRRQTFRKLMLPTSLPVMFAGFKTAMTFALLAVVVAEFISADKGLGVLVSKYSFQLNSDDAFAIIAVLTILGLVLYAAMELADRTVVFWQHDARMSARTRRLNRRDERRAVGTSSSQPNSAPRDRLERPTSAAALAPAVSREGPTGPERSSSR